METRAKLFTLPNALTLANLSCGCVAVVWACLGDVHGAFWLVVAGAGFDFLDGFIARLLKQNNPIGKQLDSLADVVTFGLAPALTLLHICATTPWQWAILVLPLAAALRLARFNTDEGQKTEFKGLPTPAGGLLIASVAMLSAQGMMPRSTPEMMLGLAIVVAYLYISPIRMFSLKFQGFGWEENRLRYQFLICSAVLVVALKWTALPAIIGLYIVVSTIRWAAGR